MEPTGSTGDAVQPGTPPVGGEPAQGQDALSGLYDLQSVPEEARPFVEAELKKINDGVAERFRENAEYRKGWEPFEQIEGLRDIPAEELSELIQFREIASDPQRLEEWWEAVGTEMGFFDSGDGDGPDADGGEGGDEMPSWAQQLMQRLDGLEQSVQPLQQHISEQDKQRAENAANEKIRSDLDALKAEHGDFDEVAVLKLAVSYGGEPDAIARGFEDYRQITGQAQGSLVDEKLGQPAPAINGGRPDTTPQKITTFGPEMKEAALARFRS